jgi:hypothetical protein
MHRTPPSKPPRPPRLETPDKGDRMATPLLEFIKDVDEGGVQEEKAKKAVALFSDLGISNLLEL